jgi:hypothetical protein
MTGTDVRVMIDGRSTTGDLAATDAKGTVPNGPAAKDS